VTKTPLSTHGTPVSLAISQDGFFITDILPSTWNYGYIVSEIRATVNIAKGRRNWFKVS
jgi:hypothetical protein